MRYWMVTGSIILMGACSASHAKPAVVPAITDTPREGSVHLVGTVSDESGGAYPHADLRLWRYVEQDTLVLVARQEADSSGGFIFRDLQHSQRFLLETRFIGTYTGWSQIHFPQFLLSQVDTLRVTLRASKVTIINH